MPKYYRNIKEILPQIFKSDLDGTRGIRTNNSDRIIGIVGGEGSGKSTLGLIYTEAWYKYLEQEVTETLINNICSNEEDFANILPKVKKYDLIALDEAVLSSYSRTSISQTNVVTNKFLMTCRGLNLKILLLIPNILDLDSYIRKTRLSACYFVLPNYKVAYFSRKRLRTLLPKMAEMSKQGKFPDPMKCGVFPNFVAKFEKYTGILEKPYNAKKEAGMEKVKQMLLDSIDAQQRQANGMGTSKGQDAMKHKNNKEVSPLRLKVKYALERGMPKADIVRTFECSVDTINNTIKAMMKGFSYKKTRNVWWDYQATQQLQKEINMGAHINNKHNDFDETKV